MKIRIRDAHIMRDFYFYFRVLMNPETQSLMFDNKNALWTYFFSPKYECRYICQSYRDGHWKSIALVHFSKGNDGAFWLAGAIPKKTFNSGNGLYAAVAFVTEFFKTHPNAIIKSGSFTFNQRSYRVTSSLGFHLEKKDDYHYESSITKEQFDNEFVNKIKRRINI